VCSDECRWRQTVGTTLCHELFELFDDFKESWTHDSWHGKHPQAESD
jgi:hypothetical protein